MYYITLVYRQLPLNPEVYSYDSFFSALALVFVSVHSSVNYSLGNPKVYMLER